METYPAAVIVPHRDDREKWFQEYSLPAIRKNSPAQLIVEGGPSSFPEKMNSGSIKAIQPYLIFAFDNVILGDGSIKRMVGMAEKNQRSSIIYGDFSAVQYKDVLSPMAHGAKKAGPWSLTRLYSGNFIGGAFLIRRESFIFTDISTDLYLWDLFLRMAKSGAHASYLPEALSEVHYLDVHGSSSREKFVTDLGGMRKKHPEIQ